MERGQILIKILEFIYDQAVDQVDFFSAVLSAGYGASSGKIDYEYRNIKRADEKSKIEYEEFKNKKIRLQKFISKLKHQGFIQEIKKEEGVKWKISKTGKEKLRKLKEKFINRSYDFDQTQNNPIIISFDIPEKLRKKRAWLRGVVKNFGFNMVHKSVWVGHGKIPQEFIDDLVGMNLVQFVEIFQISKKGTLEKIGNK
jgi:DNA-binding transcriptional regulator PaaX